VPLVVLVRGIPDSDETAVEQEHRRQLAAIAGISSNGKMVVATNSGHHVQLQEPELVTQSIREVLTAVWK